MASGRFCQRSWSMMEIRFGRLQPRALQAVKKTFGLAGKHRPWQALSGCCVQASALAPAPTFFKADLRSASCAVSLRPVLPHHCPADGGVAAGEITSSPDSPPQ